MPDQFVQTRGRPYSPHENARVLSKLNKFMSRIAVLLLSVCYAVVRDVPLIYVAAGSCGLVTYAFGRLDKQTRNFV